MNNTHDYSIANSSKTLLYKVYGFMAMALTITAATALYVVNYPLLLHKLITSPWILFTLFLAQLLLVIILSAAILRLSFGMALSFLMLYSLLLGITLSTLFIMYTQSSIYTALFVTAGMFICMSLYGLLTKSDLTAVGSYSFMALCGLIIGFIVNMFLRNGMFDYILSLVGVVVFTLLTAYDVQKIKRMGTFLAGQGESENKIAILGALSLYLDFINLFLMLLRIMGRRNKR